MIYKLAIYLKSFLYGIAFVNLKSKFTLNYSFYGY